MGHAFQDTLMDMLIRRHKSMGYATLWQVGSDHAGIATQMLVERQIEQEGLSRHDLGREEFTKKIWQWKERSGGQIMSQLKRLGVAVDWSRERFTLDKSFSSAVTEAFVKLYRDGLIYRKKRLVNWDCHLQSAISDLEVEYHTEVGKLYRINYQIEHNQGVLPIVTTRPETIFGDVAIAVHPDDERYCDFIGQKVIVPLIERAIPIIADERVQQDFGSGCVKITPAHDFLDFEIGQDHRLEFLTILDERGYLNEYAPKQFQGMCRMQARPLVAEHLKDTGALVLEQDYEHQVPRCGRTGEVIEPRLTTQWFLSMSKMATMGLEALDKNELNFIPQMWTKHYCHWLENIEDWCLSRQLWWGHQIPAWYDDDGHVYVAQSEEEARSFHSLSHEHNLTRDNDVLDTWFSSALWPMATLGWPNTATPDWQRFFPTQVLVTGFDIIFFWVARMIMFSLYFTKKVPFKDIYIHGILQDSQGKKMSKSKGNVIDPCDLIDGISLEALVEKRTAHLMQPEMAAQIAQQTRKDFPEGFPAYGADALRFTFCQQASPGRFIRFSQSKLLAGSNFCNKIWNMARFCDMYFTKPVDLEKVEVSSGLCHWICATLDKASQEIDKHYANYRFDLIANDLYELTWSQICDWYLELIKKDLREGNSQQMAMLAFVIIKNLQLLHPVMPFITDKIYSHLRESLQLQKKLPEFIWDHRDMSVPAYEKRQAKQFDEVITAISQIRSLRTKLEFPKKACVPVTYKKSSRLTQSLEGSVQYLESLAQVSSISENDGNDNSRSLKYHLNDEVFWIALPDNYDVTGQLTRFNKDCLKLSKEISSIEKRLANENFCAKAPRDVVEKERHQLEFAKNRHEDIQDLIEQLNELS